MNNKAFQDKLRSRLPALVLALCLLQPLLDIAGFWQETLGIPNTATLLIRMLLLAGFFALGFCLTEHRSRYWALLAVLAALTALHVWACTRRPGGYQAPVTDLVNLVRIYQLPVMTLCLVTFFRQNERAFPAAQKGLAIVLLIIVLVQLLSTLTGTDPHTYAVHQVGTLGWFLWTNSQSVVLSMLFPIALTYVLRRWPDKLLAWVLTTAVGCGSLYFLGTRLAFASFVGVGFGMAACLMIIDLENWKRALSLALVACLFLALYPFSPARKEASIGKLRTRQTAEKIEEMDIRTDPQTGLPAERDGETADKLEELYRSRKLLPSMIDTFGRDRVFRAYGYSLDPEVLRSVRKAKLTFGELRMEDAGLPSRLFGLSLADMTAQRVDENGETVTDNYDVENDFHGIYFLTGYTGLALLALFLLAFGLRALGAVIRRPKEIFTPAMAGYAMAFGIAIIQAAFTACILRRPNASIYLSLILASLWILSERAAPAGGPEPRSERA